MSNTATVFRSYGAYYDLLYKDKDYEAEVDYVDQLLQRVGMTGNHLLELGSGSGKHGALFAQRGYRIHGIERSEDLIRLSQPVEGFSCEQGDIRDFNLGKTFDAVLALFHVMSYQVENRDVEAVFKQVERHLKPGGIFVCDIWYSPAVLKQGPEVRLKRVTGNGLDISRIAEPFNVPNENRVDVNYTLFVHDTADNRCDVLKETHAMRHFSLPELDLWAAGNGFERIVAEEFLSGKNPGEDTWGVCLAFKRT